MNQANEFIIENGVLQKYTGAGGNVVIPDGVKEIGKAAFENNVFLTAVTIPVGVLKIGFDAFRCCTNLSAVQFSDDIVEIKQEAFCFCESLTCITLPAGLKAIGNRAFSNCKSLQSCTFPQGLTRIGIGAFACCTGLRYRNRIGSICILRRLGLFDTSRRDLQVGESLFPRLHKADRCIYLKPQNKIRK